MVRAYLLENPAESVSIEDLAKLNVFYAKIDVNNYEKPLGKICEERNYKNRDFVTLTKQTPGLEEKLKIFFEEHYHNDEEIRYVMDGSGYFDVRNHDDKWVRICVEKDDMIILPPKIYHRFTLDDNRYIKAMRLFQDEPKWEAIPRK